MSGEGNRYAKAQQKAVFARLEKAKAEMIGKRFGQLIVKEHLRSGWRGFIWLCECSCDQKTQTEASSAALVEGRKQSCGCDIVSKRIDRAKVALIGKKFGLLTVISYLGSGKGGLIWECQCSCSSGVKTQASSYQLKAGVKRSCGCLRVENIAKYRPQKGHVFGKRKPSSVALARLDQLKNEYIGKKLGLWEILDVIRGNDGAAVFDCRCCCESQTRRVQAVQTILRGVSRSCGCRIGEVAVATHTVHGMSKTAEFSIGQGMRSRCDNPDNPAYHNYGGRGISYCQRWAKFENFLEDMKVRPSRRHSLDRVNNEGNYEPGNCRWATKVQQCRNMRKTVMITYRDQTKSALDWDEFLGFTLGTVRNRRLVLGWSVERTIETPLDTSKGYNPKA